MSEICECEHDHLSLGWSIKEGKETGIVIRTIKCKEHDCPCKKFKAKTTVKKDSTNLKTLNRDQIDKINKMLTKEAESNSRNNMGALSFTQINRIYGEVIEDDSKSKR